MSKTERKYSTYDRELLAIYLSNIAIRHFRYMVEGREFTVYTDHKPLTFAFFKINSESETPRRTRHLIYISEFTTSIQYISGDNNKIADALSRVATVDCPTVINFDELAQSQEHDDNIPELLKCTNSHFQLKKKRLPTCEEYIYCDVSNNKIRPYLTEPFRRIAFNSIHNLCHPGSRTSRKMVRDRFFWPNMNQDIGHWAKTCVQCQRAKVSRHTTSALETFLPCDRFEHIHVDIVGPLPTSTEGFRYCLTIIDRRTRWPECFPIRDITAETVARIVFEGWVSRFGCPKRLTSDQGRQFESRLFSELIKLLGISKSRTTPYHPQCNGAVEHWHRSLKAALIARLCNKSSLSWVDELPSVLLGLRTAVRSDNGICAAQMTYGTTLRLPADYYDSVSSTAANLDSSCEYVNKLREIIQQYKSTSVRQNINPNLYIHPDLRKCDFVFVRNDAVRKPLQPTYAGPFRVLSRGSKVYEIQLPGRKCKISIDRLKPAYVIDIRSVT